jgi:hypothetical protein
MAISTIDGTGLGTITNLNSGANAMTLQTNGTTALTVDTSQKVGIGTTSPASILQVSATTPVVKVTGTSTTASSQDFTTNSAAQRATIGVEQSAGGGLFVGSSAYAAVFGSAGASSAQFATNNTVRATIDTSGNLTFNTSNAGIIFNNSSALTNSTLNDYEAGTWSPNQGSGVTAGGTFGSDGRYTKIGRIVSLYGYVYGGSSINISAFGQICSNLPFTANGGIVAFGAGFQSGILYVSGTGDSRFCQAFPNTTLNNGAVAISGANYPVYFSITYTTT